MTIKQTSKLLKLKFMDHQEDYKFCIGNMQLNRISGILKRDQFTIFLSIIKIAKFISLRTIALNTALHTKF